MSTFDRKPRPAFSSSPAPDAKPASLSQGKTPLTNPLQPQAAPAGGTGAVELSSPGASEAGESPPAPALRFDFSRIPLYPPLRESLQRTFGPEAARIPIHPRSSLATGARGLTVNGEVHLAPGFDDVRSADGRGRVGHEVAHALQQRAGAGGGLTGARRANLEAEAGLAARSFIEGTPFAIRGQAPARLALYDGDPPNGLPPPQTVRWGGDPFTITFERSQENGSDSLSASIEYTGPFPLEGPSLEGRRIRLRVTLGSAPLRAVLLPPNEFAPGENALSLDLYGNGARVVKLLDRVRVDASPGKGRHHDLSFGFSGGSTSYLSVWVKDPNARPATEAPSPATQGDLPGENPASLMDLRTLGAELRIDGDGDQSKELLLHLVPKDQWPDPTFKDVPRNMQLRVMQLSSRQERAFMFQLPAPAPHARGSFFPLFREATDGKAPSRISLVLPTDSQPLLIYPPTRDTKGVTYRITVAGQQLTAVFPPEKVVHRIASAGEVRTAGGISSVDITLGAYRDRFRLTVTRSGGSAMLGISALGPQGPSGGTGVPLQFAGVPSLEVLDGDGLSLALDLDHDQQADLRLHDRLDSPAEVDGGGNPEQNRNHQLRVVGPAVGGEKLFHFTVRQGSLRGGAARPSREDQLAASSAQAITGLGEQAALGSVSDELNAYEGAMRAERHKAASRGLLGKGTYQAWTELSADMVRLEPQANANNVQPALRDQASAHAAAFYQALADETRGEVRFRAGHGWWSTSNPYTGANISPAGERGAGPELAGSLKNGRWQAALSQYRLLVQGMDQWIVERLRKAGRTQDVQDAQRVEYLGAMREQLEALRGKPGIRRVQAVFHPDEQYKSTARIFEVPLSLLLWSEGGKWHLKDITNPKNTFEDTEDAARGQSEPPRSLFEKLDYKVHFPKGIIHYQVPGGSGGRIETTERRSWHEYLSYIGLGAAAVGVSLATFGTGTVAVAGAWVLAGSGVIGAVAAAGDVEERLRHGNRDWSAISLDVAAILAGLAGASALAAGRITLGATAAARQGQAWSGLAARLAVFSERLYLPLNLGKGAADALTLVVLTDQIAGQLDQIEQAPGSRSDKDRAKALVLAQFLATGGILALGIKGSLPRPGRGQRLYLHFPAEGPPVATLLQHLEETTQGLRGVRPHLTDTDFLARAERANNLQVSLTNNKKVPATKIVFLEPMPGSSPLKVVEVLDDTGAALGKLKATADGFQIPLQPAARVRVTLADGTVFEWIPTQAPHPGYRLAIKPSKPFQEAGFSGGHTREAWAATMRAYGDKIKVTSQQKLGFRVPGDKVDTEIRGIRYEYDGKAVNVPKTFFEGQGTGSLTNFEKHLYAHASYALESAAPTDRLVAVKVPVVDGAGNPAVLKVIIARDVPAAGDRIGTIRSWWISEENFTNPQLVRPP
ncbi:DUF4157 domain-containing protein [Myxococcus sp. RHSTA-1-4]|uniref:eCIS core domain-containing protein n=1 Tax=Myxococcus sp. RHSTA-1-4 TaxID=2874601 RepID=UPI001CC1B319|nr:DUF4157 domain-containing protein [Myxococcus sp. RHSTA-1-4]MBZ4416010.1 DUF4157 domain-containing protein [Myxococcus sp. RHSTA-1-4]